MNSHLPTSHVWTLYLVHIILVAAMAQTWKCSGSLGRQEQPTKRGGSSGVRGHLSASFPARLRVRISAGRTNAGDCSGSAFVFALSRHVELCLFRADNRLRAVLSRQQHLKGTLGNRKWREPQRRQSVVLHSGLECGVFSVSHSAEPSCSLLTGVAVALHPLALGLSSSSD